MVICVYYDNEVHIAWDKTPNVDGYKLYQKTGESLYTSFKEVTQNHVSLFGMTDNQLKIKPFKRVQTELKYDYGYEKFTLGQEEFVEEFETLINTVDTTVNVLWKKIKNANIPEW